MFELAVRAIIGQKISVKAANPNAFPESDLELQKQIKKFNLHPQKWVPWRSYAAILLFSLGGLNEKT